MIPSEKSCAIRINKLWLIVIVIVAWAFEPMLQVPTILRNIPFAVDYIYRMFPPDLTILPLLWEPLQETIQMAFAGTLLATTISLPLSFLAASNTAPGYAVRAAIRGLFNLLRAMPTLVWAMMFVSLAGLGPLAGVFGITCHAIGTLGKMFLECIEVAGPRIKDMLEAMRLDGATERQLIHWALIPEVLPLFASYVLYRLEVAVRASTILGMVGAGGLGLELTMAIRMFRRRETLAIILVILALVVGVDSLSAQLRKRILSKGGY